MQVPFLKISATGNDFILFDNRQGRWQAERDAAFFRQICRRGRSIGADGVILLENSRVADFRYVHINADGSIAEMCGNGSRAVVHFAASLGIIDNQADFEINSHIYHAFLDDNLITTEFIPPGSYDLAIDIVDEHAYIAGGFIDTGVPHFVLFVEDVEQAEVERIGKKYRNHSFFPAGTNVDFVQVVAGGADRAPLKATDGRLKTDSPQPKSMKDDTCLRVRTFERGVEAETLACGTGAVAAAIISHLKKNTKSPTLLHFPGGTLLVEFDASLKKIKLTGEVTPVYQGQLLG